VPSGKRRKSTAFRQFLQVTANHQGSVITPALHRLRAQSRLNRLA